jgi:hypothetical protein
LAFSDNFDSGCESPLKALVEIGDVPSMMNAARPLVRTSTGFESALMAWRCVSSARARFGMPNGIADNVQAEAVWTDLMR